jgi:hypothetical protein
LHEHILALLGESHDLDVPVGDGRKDVLEVGDDLVAAVAGPVGEALDGLGRVELPERGGVVSVEDLKRPADQLRV